MGIRLFGRRDDLRSACVELAIADVVGDRPGKQIDVLLNDADVLPQGAHAELADIATVEQDLPLTHFIEARDQRAKRRLAHAGCPDQCHVLAGLNVSEMFLIT